MKRLENKVSALINERKQMLEQLSKEREALVISYVDLIIDVFKTSQSEKDEKLLIWSVLLESTGKSLQTLIQFSTLRFYDLHGIESFGDQKCFYELRSLLQKLNSLDYYPKLLVDMKHYIDTNLGQYVETHAIGNTDLRIDLK